MENRYDDSLIISAISNPTKAVQLAGESFRRNIKEIADKQFPLPFEPNQIDLANRKINWRPGQKEKLANDAVSFATGNSPAMALTFVDKGKLKNIISVLEKNNKSTYPKIPTGNVFNNVVGELPLDLKLKADEYFSKNGLPVKNIGTNNLIPTQKNLTSKNISSVNGIDEPINAVFHNGNYYITDGHHRSALAKLADESSIPSYVYEDLYTSLPETEFSKAHALAQKNAALPVEQGGLGLHPDNTAMERARALGFDVDSPVYHGTNNDFDEFSQQNIYTTDDPKIAGLYTSNKSANIGNPNILPLYSKAGNQMEVSDFKEGTNIPGYYPDNIRKIFSGDKGKKRILTQVKENGIDRLKINDVIDLGGEGQTQYITFDPKNIRSRFAAFDPLKKNSANILAGAALGSTLLEKDKKRKDK